MSKIKVSIIIPVYNEESIIRKTIEEIQNVVKELKIDYEIIVINDGSTDDSWDIIDKIKGIRTMHHSINKGYGATLKTGILNSKGDWILITDADGTYPPDAIKDLLRFVPDYDVVIGARTGKHVKIPLSRKPAKFILTLIANYLSGTKIPDLNSGLRIFKKSMALDFFHLFPQGFSFTTTITMACLTSQYSVKFVPINYYKRKGKSTIHPINDFINFIILLTRITTYFNPLKIFMTISFLLILVSLIIFIYSNIFLGKIMDISIVILFLTAIQIFLFGLIADLIVKSRSR